MLIYETLRICGVFEFLMEFGQPASDQENDEGQAGRAD
jgi:hypothetical protein